MVAEKLPRRFLLGNGPCSVRVTPCALHKLGKDSATAFDASAVVHIRVPQHTDATSQTITATITALQNENHHH
jgi:hypothetical protein